MSGTSRQPGELGYEAYAAQNRGPGVLTTIATLTSLVSLFVIARLYSRAISIRKTYIDDWLIVISNILSITYVILASIAINHGAGRHLDTLDPANATVALRYLLYCAVLGILSCAIPKFAVVVLLAKILSPSRVHIAIMWIISIAYLLVTIANIVVINVQCPPGPLLGGGAQRTCLDLRVAYNAQLSLSIPSILFDFYLAGYPTVVLCRMTMNWRKKLVLCSALGFGYGAGIISTYKCTTLTVFLSMTDFTYAVNVLIVWANVEANFVLIGACIPTLYPLLKQVFGSLALSGVRRPIGREEAGGVIGLGPVDPSQEVMTFGSPRQQTKPVQQSASDCDTFNDTANLYIIREEGSVCVDDSLVSTSGISS